MNRIIATVIPIGSAVRIGPVDDQFPGTIVGIAIYGRQVRITYQVSYWNGRSNEQKWLEAFEVEAVDNPQPMAIGFSNGK